MFVNNVHHICVPIDVCYAHMDKFMLAIIVNIYLQLSNKKCSNEKCC